MKPAITTQGKTTQLRYELPHRVHGAQIYPVKAPNGSTIILYGQETGVGILWRGGRPLKAGTAPQPSQPAKPPKVNGTSSDAIMIIDSDDDEPSTNSDAQAPPPAVFEDEEEELDPDQPYPSIIQQLRLPLNTEVLHIAVPRIPTISALRSADTVPEIFSKKIVFTVACADYSVRIITLPLNPPSHAAKETPAKGKSQFGEEIVKIPTHAGHQSIPRGVAMTWTSRADLPVDVDSSDEMDVDEGNTEGNHNNVQTRSRLAQGNQSQSQLKTVGKEGWDLFIASHSTDIGGLLKIYRFQLTETSIAVKNPVSPYQTLNLRTPASAVSFNSAQWPKRRHSQLLITNASGIARIYDPLAPQPRKRQAGAEPDRGCYVALFRSTFERDQSNTTTSPILAERKPILDAAWARDGYSIFALLGDGEWGIWNVVPGDPKQSPDASAFSSRGFVGTSANERSSNGATSPKRSARSNLAPMTPNTRRTKQENLFAGPTSSSSIPTRGSLSIASLPPSNGGVTEDSIIIQYGADVYRIANLAQFSARSASGSSNSPTRLPTINLLGETIVSVTQFDSTVEDARKAIARDVLIATEHRLIIMTTATLPLGRDLNAVFQRERADEQEARRTDQTLLAHGELDIGGMDRLLEDMEGSGSRSLALGNPRKVLFASSTS